MDRWHEYRRTWKTKRIARGYCYWCVKRKATEGMKSCAVCRDKRNREMKWVSLLAKEIRKALKVPKKRMPRPMKPELLAFKRKPPMHEGSERIDKMLALIGRVEKLKAVSAAAGR